MLEFRFRYATQSDIPFLIDTIIEAEKSGTDILTYTTIFGLSEEETRKYLAGMLAEEVDGCELSISSFFLADYENRTVAAVAAWVEGSEGMPSTVLKGNLLKYVLPREAMERAVTLNSVVQELHIEYIPDSIQIGLIYVSKDFRGQNLVRLLIDQQIKNLREKYPASKGIYVQVFGNNLAAIKAYENVGFRQISVKESLHTEIRKYMPHNTKVLMFREV
jgi:ribosomal protein S18 acetylase RimI-like enzyme